jgi:DNA-directed RNA polymerase subunit RPC12/RpoP
MSVHSRTKIFALMDIIFNCPNCDQELAVDSAGAGTDIECPSCHETITIPVQSAKDVPTPASSSAIPTPSLAPSPINSSAAAKIEMHLKVPVRDTPGERLIVKAKPPLEAVARGAGRQIRTHTIKHGACIEAGHDKFDEVVTKFLNEVGEPNIIGIHTISYSFLDIGTQKLLNDYGVLVVYRG